jgi:hypothetical protein
VCLFIVLLPRLQRLRSSFLVDIVLFYRSSTPVRERHQQLQHQLPSCSTSSRCPACARPKRKPTSAWTPHCPQPLPPSSPHRAPSTRPAARATCPASPPSAGRITITTTTTARGSRPGTPPRRPHREIAAAYRLFCRASLRSAASTATPQLQLRHSCRQRRPATARAVLAICAAARRSSALTSPAAGSTRTTTTTRCSCDDSWRTPRTTWTRWTAR